MKKISGDENFRIPIFLIFFFSILFMSETPQIMKNIEVHGSIILSEPIFFTDNISETLTRFCWFLFPAGLLLTAFKEKDLFLKLTEILGSIPLVLTTPVINKLGFKSLYVIKVLIIFAVIMCMMKYLISKTDLYKKFFQEQTDNKATAPDATVPPLM